MSTNNKEIVDDQLPDEHILPISLLSPWFADIENFLVAGYFHPILSSKEKRKFVKKSAPYTWIWGNLFRFGPNEILRRHVREDEVFDILSACYDGSYGVHFSSKRTNFQDSLSRLLLAYPDPRC